jgi:succinate dehydrogenase / fumarate reductase flavoprotein subunit
LLKPRPRLYGLVGAEVIEEVWKERNKETNQSNETNAGNKKLVGAS